MAVANNNLDCHVSAPPREVPCDEAQAKLWLSDLSCMCMAWNKAQQPPHEACS